MGPPRRSFPGIDGWLNNQPISLKGTVSKSPVSVLRNVSQAEAEASAAGYSGVEVFVKAENVTKKVMLDFIQKGPLREIPRQGTISAITIECQDGWIRIP